ncbi:MAG: glutamine--tRNA ligase, partial [Clostridia bacterium]|nr:glutamine--tRNA ligase [Clostridia bacterium]
PSRPRQIEFARLNVTNTVMSKRFLRHLVETGLVDGWDDPRMPTLCGMRRRGYTPAAILDFIERVGVAKNNSLVDIALLEHCVREDLNIHAQRRVAVFDPVKVTVTNYPADKTEYFELPNNPNDPESGSRKLPFTRELFVEREDVSLDPPPKYFRMKKEGEVRLMGAYIVKVNDILTDSEGNITEVMCEADLETGNGMPADGRKIKGTIHWLSAGNCAETEVTEYGRLFTEADMNSVESARYGDYLDPQSKRTVKGVKIERALLDSAPGEKFQFVRKGYYCRDTKDPGTFNSIVELKDSKKF